MFHHVSSCFIMFHGKTTWSRGYILSFQHGNPWESMVQEGDDLHFEVVDYDRGALQGDLMCSCIVPNKERESTKKESFPENGKLKEEHDDI